MVFRQTSLILDHYLRFEVKSVYNNSIDGKLVYKEHLAIGEAIFKNQHEKAALAMQHHLSNSYTRTLGRIWKTTPERVTVIHRPYYAISKSHGISAPLGGVQIP